MKQTFQEAGEEFAKAGKALFHVLFSPIVPLIEWLINKLEKLKIL